MTIAPSTGWRQINYQLVGFDRHGFVSDVLEAVPQTDDCQLLSIHFEADGLRAVGRLALRLSAGQLIGRIDQRLHSVRGMVRVETV